MPPASNALDAAFVNTAFSQQSPHGDSALPYGIPHGSAAVHAAGADVKPPDIPMGVSDDKAKEKKKREGGWSGSPGAKGQSTNAGASTPVPASPRGTSPSKVRKGTDDIDARLRAIEQRLGAAEARFEVEKLDAFAADVLAHRIAAERRIDTLGAAHQVLAAAQQANLLEIGAIFARCDQALMELQAARAVVPPGLGSSGPNDPPPPHADQRALGRRAGAGRAIACARG